MRDSQSQDHSVRCKITASGPANCSGTRWTAELSNLPDGRKLPPFLVGKTVGFRDGDGQHLGIGQSGLVNAMPKLAFDPEQHESGLGPWAYFMWPTILAESGGRHLTFNSYDRARFTFGFYQLAAHTPGDNLILLFRRLLDLPDAAAFLPDLRLNQGKVCQISANGALLDLENPVAVRRPNGKVENQLLHFMLYLNNNDQTIEIKEVEVAARLMGWLMTSQAARSRSVEVAHDIMLRKLRSAAQRHQLVGGPVEAAIWVSDILHQGRATHAVIARALSRPGPAARLTALSEIGADNPSYDGRRSTVQQAINRIAKAGHFRNLRFGEGPLVL